MEKMQEKEMLRTMKKIEANTGSIARELGRIAQPLRAWGGMDAKTEPEEAATEVTPAQAREAIETIKEYCEQIPLNECDSSTCPIVDWCIQRDGIPSEWSNPYA